MHSRFQMELAVCISSYLTDVQFEYARNPSACATWVAPVTHALDELQRGGGIVEVREAIIELAQAFDTAWDELENITDGRGGPMIDLLGSHIGCWDLEWVPTIITARGINWPGTTPQTIVEITHDLLHDAIANHDSDTVTPISNEDTFV